MEIVNTNLSDKEVIQSIINGNKEAFKILFDRYAGMWLGYAYTLCRDHDIAADIVQESMITAYNCLDRIRDTASFPSWVAGIIKNTYRNLVRKKTISTIPLDDLVEKGLDPPDSDISLSQNKEELAAVMKYIDSLPEIYKEVVMLRYIEDFSYKKISELLNIPETTVTMRLAHARKQLILKAKEDGLL